jgi:CBS domain containing-hemolysin-like protein
MESMTALLVILGCFLLSAFFSGSETALLRLRASEVELDAKSGRGPSAPALRELLRSTSRLLVTILLGNNLVNLLAASVASAVAVAALGEQAGVVVATLVLTVTVLVFCEVLPKAVAARNPERFAHAIALPLYLMHQGLRPVHVAYDRWLEPLVRRVSGGAASDESIPPDEVLRIAMRAGKGQPQGTPLAIIAAAADAVDTQVHEIMVPGSEIVAYPIDMPPAELLEKFLEERYTRAPLYKESIDRFEGVAHLKDLVKLVREEGSDLREILKPVLRVPEGKRILELLAEMQRAFVHMAVVKDEFGNTEGIVTQEDILEELVGEIRAPDGLGRARRARRDPGWTDLQCPRARSAQGRCRARGRLRPRRDRRLGHPHHAGARSQAPRVRRRRSGRGYRDSGDLRLDREYIERRWVWSS